MVRTRKGHNMRSNAVGLGALLAACCCGLLRPDTCRLLQAARRLSPVRLPAIFPFHGRALVHATPHAVCSWRTWSSMILATTSWIG